MSFLIKGEGRVIIHEPDGVEVVDTGWVSNTITDASLVRLVTGTGLIVAQTRLFIHANTNAGRVFNTSFLGGYTNQTPNQVRNPDVVVSDQNTGISTFTVQYPTPAVARNINIVGLTAATSTTGTFNEVAGVLAYTKLTATVVQGTSQTADVQYRITWSFP